MSGCIVNNDRSYFSLSPLSPPAVEASRRKDALQRACCNTTIQRRYFCCPTSGWDISTIHGILNVGADRRTTTTPLDPSHRAHPRWRAVPSPAQRASQRWYPGRRAPGFWIGKRLPVSLPDILQHARLIASLQPLLIHFHVWID